MTDQIHRILTRVQKPARYVGGEYNQIVKRNQDIDVRVAFCFPDTYEIGMSNLGMRILYGVMNNIEGVWCERCFAPWGDMEQEMRNANIPLYALESFDPIKDFDIIAFSIGYEMAFPAALYFTTSSGSGMGAGSGVGAGAGSSSCFSAGFCAGAGVGAGAHRLCGRLCHGRAGSDR